MPNYLTHSVGLVVIDCKIYKLINFFNSREIFFYQHKYNEISHIKDIKSSQT